jgi:chemotaxis family two-component system response regulator Rcp1
MPEVDILLVEDAAPDVFLVREALKQAGVTLNLRVLGDGEQALDFIDHLDKDDTIACPRLVLLDLNLPKRTGDQILAHMRRSERCSGIPVIIVTSSDLSKDKEYTARLGANGYFRKPSRLDEFMKLGILVRRMLEA